MQVILVGIGKDKFPILNGLLNNHGECLDTESLQTLMVECEAILNSRPLTVDTAIFLNNPAPVAPANILTMKTNVILPPPRVFERPDIFSKQRRRRAQHIANEFWARWKKEFLCQLQFRQKWNDKQQNFEVGDVVLLKRDSEMNGQWQYLRRSCLIIMVLSEVSNFRLGKQMRQSKSNFGKTSTQNCFAS